MNSTMGISIRVLVTGFIDHLWVNRLSAVEEVMIEVKEKIHDLYRRALKRENFRLVSVNWLLVVLFLRSTGKKFKLCASC